MNLPNQIIHQTIPLAAGTDVRILSWNILSEELSPIAPDIRERIDRIAGTVRALAPDAMGIQEISESGYALFAEKLPEYVFTNPKTAAGEYSFTGVAYRRDRYLLTASGIENFDRGNARIRLMNWIHLEAVEGDRKFTLVSTHWDRHARNRPADSDQMARYVLLLTARFGDPVICTGDFNTRENAEIFQSFLSVSGQRDAKYLAPSVVNLCFTGHPVGSFVPESEEETSIDHITVADGIRVLQYEQMINQTVVDVSDHFPVCADLRFPQGEIR